VIRGFLFRILIDHDKQPTANLMALLSTADNIERLSEKSRCLVVKSRQIIGTFFEQLGLFLGPVFHRLKWRTVAQCFLRDVLIVDLNVAFDGIGEVLGGVEAGGG